jgi:hypothetical protein
MPSRCRIVACRSCTVTRFCTDLVAVLVGLAVRDAAARAAAGTARPRSRRDCGRGRRALRERRAAELAAHTTSVSSSRPRAGEVVEQAGDGLVDRACVALVAFDQVGRAGPSGRRRRCAGRSARRSARRARPSGAPAGTARRSCASRRLRRRARRARGWPRLSRSSCHQLGHGRCMRSASAWLAIAASTAGRGRAREAQSHRLPHEANLLRCSSVRASCGVTLASGWRRCGTASPGGSRAGSCCRSCRGRRAGSGRRAARRGRAARGCRLPRP